MLLSGLHIARASLYTVVFVCATAVRGSSQISPLLKSFANNKWLCNVCLLLVIILFSCSALAMIGCKGTRVQFARQALPCGVELRFGV